MIYLRKNRIYNECGVTRRSIAGKVSSYKSSPNEISQDEMSPDELPADEVLLDEVSLDEMSSKLPCLDAKQLIRVRL